MKRVVITGLGVITPVGNDLKTFWDNLINGVCGIDTLDRFDTTEFKVKLAGEVRGFKPADYGIDVPSARHMDLYTQYAMAAAWQAAADSGISGTVAPERLGVYVGSGRAFSIIRFAAPVQPRRPTFSAAAAISLSAVEKLPRPR